MAATKGRIAFGLISLAYLAWVAVAFPEVRDNLHQRWTTAGDLDFGYLLLAIAIGIGLYIGERTPRWPLPVWVFPTALLASQVAALVARAAGVESVLHVTLLAGWPLLVVTLGSQTLAAASLRAASIVLMALPIWYLLIRPLQLITAWVAEFWVSLAGITAYVEGTYISLPSGTIHIAGGCSGIKYLLSALALALINNAILKQTLRREIGLLALAALFAMAANWIRVTLLVFVGYFESVDHPLIDDHDFFGWCVFAVIVLIYLGIEVRIPRAIPEAPDRSTPNGPGVALAATVALIALALPSSLTWREPNPATLPENLFAWQALGESAPARTWWPDFSGDDQRAGATLVDGESGRRVDVAELAYASGEGELINVNNHLIAEDRGWSLRGTASRSGFGIARYASRRGKGESVVVWRYEYGDADTLSPLRIKLAEALDTLIGQRRLGSLLAARVDCALDCDAAERAAISVLRDVASESVSRDVLADSSRER